MTPEEQSTFEQQLETDEQLRMALESAREIRGLAQEAKEAARLSAVPSLEEITQSGEPSEGQIPRSARIFAPWLGL